MSAALAGLTSRDPAAVYMPSHVQGRQYRHASTNPETEAHNGDAWRALASHGAMQTKASRGAGLPGNASMHNPPETSAPQKGFIFFRNPGSQLDWFVNV